MMSFDAGVIFAMGLTADGGSPLLQIVPFILILAIFYFIILLPSKRKQQKVQEFLEKIMHPTNPTHNMDLFLHQTIKQHDRIITTSGIYGQIAKINGDRVQLQVADKVRIDVSKAAIGGYQGQPPVVESANP